MKMTCTLAGALAAVVVLSACSREAAPPPDQVSADSHALVETKKLEPFECGTVERIHTLDGVFLASQPQPDDFRLAKTNGIKTIVNLRPASELEWSEADLLAELELDYHNIPFDTPDGLTDDVFDQTRALLNSKDNRPLLLHCSSANRVGAIWLAHRVLDDGLSIEDAEREATTVGLKLPAYGDKAKDYVNRMQEQGAANP